MRGNEFFVKIASCPPLTALHPAVGQFFKEYLKGEKAITFQDKLVINTQFPPYPSRAFDGVAQHLLSRGQERRLYSVTWAVTNRCDFNCWHCYNAGRSQDDVPLPIMRNVAGDLQDRGAVLVTLTGGEPLLRNDLEQICRSFDDRSCVNIGTTGWGLSPDRARALRQAGAFAIGISLDSDVPGEHDQLRARRGAFDAAVKAIGTAADAGLYPYLVSVATREFLHPDRFWRFVDFARRIGALEVHLLEPCPVGRLAGRSDLVLSAAERRQIVECQLKAAADDNLPVISTFAYLEDRSTFGCGAGVTHMYIDGSGEVCPCNLVPISFGNIMRQALGDVLDRMGRRFKRPRAACVGRSLSRHVGDGPLPAPPDLSERICDAHLPATHAVPAFVQVKEKASDSAGQAELTEAYDHVAGDYEDFWLVRAGSAVEQLVDKLALRGDELIFEAGCGTGFGSALLARSLACGGRLIAADISGQMLDVARRRLAPIGAANVELRRADALAALGGLRELDVIFTSWVLGYIPLRPFFTAAAAALKNGGRLALVVHRESSPRREWEIFAEIIAHDPTLLSKQVAFDFPRDARHMSDELSRAGLAVVDLWEDSAVFRYRSPEEVLEHLLKSGAGTVFYDAIDASRRDQAKARFLELLRLRNPATEPFDVRHDYLGCVARREP